MSFESGISPWSFMHKAFATVLAPMPPIRKSAARAALVGLNETNRTLLSECFKQFNIEAVAVTAEAAERLDREKFDACVLALADDVESVMNAARSSRSNSRCVIYGVGGSAQEAMRYSKYGINAIFQAPLERPAVLKLVRATRMLVLHELRRYARIPVMTEVSIIGDGRNVVASSIEFSSGGMSVRSAEDVTVGQSLEVSFALLTLPRVFVRATVSWRNAAGKSFGVRFDDQDQRRAKIKEWVDGYIDG